MQLYLIILTMKFEDWRLSAETKTKRTLHGSRRLSFNELTNAKKILCCFVAILLSTDAAARLCARRAL